MSDCAFPWRAYTPVMFTTSLQPEYRLFTFARVPVYADKSAIFLLALILLLYGRGGPNAMIGSIVIAAVAFVSVVGHELGHAFAVRKLGYGQSKIVLGGFGGVCQWHGRPTRGDRIRIALAGPAVSLLLGAIGMVLYLPLRPMIAGIPPLKTALAALMFLNVFWGVFNLLPIFPMDGGQALRSALGYKFSPSEARRKSLIVSGVVGGSLAVIAYLSGFWVASLVIAMLLFQNWNEWQATNP